MVYDNITMPLFGSVSHLSSFMPVMRAPGASSCTPCDSSTGMTATSTVSTSPASASVRNIDPPPNSQMSLPGFCFSSRTVSTGDVLTIRTPGRGGDLQRLRKHDDVLAAEHVAELCRRRYVPRLAPHDEGIELVENRREVNRVVHDDPVIAAIRIGNESVEGGSDGIPQASHGT